MGQTIKKRILFLYPYGYWPANPNCVSLIERCEKDSLAFDLFCPSAKNCRGLGKEVSEWVWLVRRLHFSAIKQIFRRPWKTGTLVKSLIHFYELKSRLKKGEYSLVVTCDATGLALLHRLDFKGNVPLIYLSYHILFRHEIKTKNEQVLALRETHMLSNIKLVLSQDEKRKELIAKELHFPLNTISCIPVAPEKRFPFPEKPLALRNSKMILYCGNIEKWNIEEVLHQVINSIPTSFHLRVHTHFKPPQSLYKQLLKLDEKQLLHFTFSFLSEEELVQLIDSCHVGLAPYFPKPDSWMVNQTLHHIGKASTKIAYYCMRKKPVITTPLPSLSNALKKYRFGIAVDDWSQVSEAIFKIDSQYPSFSNAAQQYYESELCPTEALNRFWGEVKGLIPSSSA